MAKWKRSDHRRRRGPSIYYYVQSGDMIQRAIQIPATDMSAANAGAVLLADRGAQPVSEAADVKQETAGDVHT